MFNLFKRTEPKSQEKELTHLSSELETITDIMKRKDITVLKYKALEIHRVKGETFKIGDDQNMNPIDQLIDASKGL